MRMAVMAEKINFFDLVADVEPDPNGKFAAVGSVERARIVSEIASIMREKAVLDRVGQIYDKCHDPEIKQKIDELTPENRAKLNFLISEGVVFDEF